MKRKITWLLCLSCLSLVSHGQAEQKKIIHNTQSWVGINSNIFISKKWFIVADIHLRENDFFKSNSFLFYRLGVGSQINPQVSLAAGYGHLHAAPALPDGKTNTEEDRLFQQVVFRSPNKKVNLVQRIRNEQRWQTMLLNERKTGESKFSNRIRYLFSCSIPVFKNKKIPQLALSDEAMLQFGNTIVFNTFDQNRFFIGLKQQVCKGFSFDAGYMNVFQQKSDGSSYNLNNTYRLFMYYTLHTETTSP